MKDILSMVVSVIFLVVLLIILPLYNYFERQDDMSYNLALKAVTTFVDEVSENGYIDQNMYDKFIQRLATTGNSYDIQVEAKKKVYTVDPENPTTDEGETQYIEQFKSYYNKDIFNDETGQTSNIIDKDNSLKDDVFFLDVGDKFYVTLKNTNTTMATALLNIIVSDSTNQKINISYGATIKNNNCENTDISQLYQSDILISIALENPNEVNEATGYPEYNLQDAQDRVLRYKVKILNSDDTNINTKLSDNIRLVGTAPNCFISPSSVESSSTDGEYIVEFTLDESRQETYLSSNEYNTFRCFLPANVIQGTFSRNASANSDYIIIKENGSVQITEE